MGVYIEGMKMPKEGYCDIVAIHSNGEVCRWLAKQNNVPIAEAIEVKEPHGRLIDEDEVLDTVKRLKSFPWGDGRGNRVPLLFEPYEVEQVIKQSPTVIEGSKE